MWSLKNSIHCETLERTGAISKIFTFIFYELTKSHLIRRIHFQWNLLFQLHHAILKLLVTAYHNWWHPWQWRWWRWQIFVFFFCLLEDEFPWFSSSYFGGITQCRIPFFIRFTHRADIFWEQLLLLWWRCMLNKVFRCYGSLKKKKNKK